nr:low temperature requirement protein A [Prevotella sp. 10(H)]
MSQSSHTSHSLLRKRGEGIATVSFSELLFDLIYVFAVTQLSHYLLHHLNVTGFLQSTVLWFAVWLGWQHTTWMTNWFDPNIRSIRAILFVLMMLGLICGSSYSGSIRGKGMDFCFMLCCHSGRTNRFNTFHAWKKASTDP